MIQDILSTIICTQIEEVLPRFTMGTAFFTSFSLPTDYAKEDGYRWLDLLVHRPDNYTKVYIREGWNIIALEDMEEDPDDPDSTVPKKDKDYDHFKGTWRRICDHDSGWRLDGIHWVILNCKIQGLKPRKGKWYELVTSVDGSDLSLWHEAYAPRAIDRRATWYG